MNILAIIKNLGLKNASSLVLILLLIIGGVYIGGQHSTISDLQFQLATAKPETTYVQGEVIPETLIFLDTLISIDTLSVPGKPETTIVYQPKPTPTACSGKIILKDHQPYFDVQTTVFYPSGMGMFAYTYRPVPERWQFDIGLGLSDDWKPFLLADYCKILGIGIEIAPKRWGIYLKRKF